MTIAPTENLGSLLEDEGILWIVLNYVAEPDVPTCRLVCRRWCRTIYRLPVRLNVTDSDALLPLACRFPHVSSVVYTAEANLTRRSRSKKRDADRPYGRLQARSDADAQAMSACPSLKALQLGSAFHFSVQLPQLFRRLKQMSRVSCRQPASESDAVPYLRTAQLSEPPISEMEAQTRSDRTRLDPGVDVELPMNTLFPSLTRLEVKRHGAYPFAQPKITLAHSGHGFRLEHLRLHALRLSDTRFFEWLRQMRRLKSLCLDYVQLAPQSIRFESLSCLESLETLCLYPIYIGDHGDQLEPPCLDGFRNLTQLHFYSCEAAPSLPYLTTLKDLSIIFRGLSDPTADLVPQLLQLEVLNLDTLFGDVYESILPLERLKSLTLASLGMSDSQFLECLTAFSRLTHLDFAHSFTEDNTLFTAIGQIATLVSLSMRSMVDKKHGCDLGASSNLNDLRLIDFVVTPSEVDALWKNLSSLKKLEIL